MKLKGRFAVFLSLFIILSVNLLFILKPASRLLDFKDFKIGIYIIAACLFLNINLYLFSKAKRKRRIVYRFKMVWLVNSFMLLSAGLITANYLAHRYIEYIRIQEIYTNLIFHLIITTVLCAVMYEFLYYIEGSASRKTIRQIEEADMLVEGGLYEEALLSYNQILLRINEMESPSLFAWICQAKGICYVEMSNLSDKKLNLERAVQNFEAALKVKEVISFAGKLKYKLGEVYFELSQVDLKPEYLRGAMVMYQDSLSYFLENDDMSTYMNVIRKVEKVKDKLLLIRFSVS